VKQPTLFDLPTEVYVHLACHDCGGPLSELDALLPHTCERSLVCVGCCQSCHSAALGRLFAAMRAAGNTDAMPRLGKRGAA
jgi:hypothetical protein